MSQQGEVAQQQGKDNGGRAAVIVALGPAELKPSCQLQASQSCQNCQACEVHARHLCLPDVQILQLL